MVGILILAGLYFVSAIQVDSPYSFDVSTRPDGTSLSNPPLGKFISYGFQTVPAYSFTTLNFTNNSFNNSHFIDEVSSNQKINIPEDGVYHIDTTVSWDSNNVGLRYTFIQKNLVTFHTCTQSSDDAWAFGVTVFSCSTLFNLNKYDNLTVLVFQVSPSARYVGFNNGDYGTSFSINKVGKI